MENSNPLDPALPLTIEKDDDSRVLLQRDDYQLLYLYSGKLYCKSAHGLIERQADVLVAIPPGEGIRVRLAEAAGVYRLCLKPWLFADYRARYWEQDFLFFFKEKITFFALPDDKAPVVKQLMETMLDEDRLQKRGYREIIRLKLSELFINLARSKTADAPAADILATARGIREIIGYLEEHYTGEITLEQVADFAGYSPAYLSRYFKKSTGVCLFAYINKIRVQKACRLLKHTDKTILEIAYATGYNNISFFNRCFKRLMNMSPAEFRRGY